MSHARGVELVEATRSRSFAIAAFNVSNLETGQAVVAAAEEAAAPVFLQLSPGAIGYAGYETLTTLAFHLAGRATVPVVVHLDHCRDPDLVERAIADGFGSVMFDGSRMRLEENIRVTARLAGIAHARGASIEGEVGIIGGIEDTTLDEARTTRTSPEEAERFVEETAVDLLAPAIGSVHRMPDDSVELDVAYLRSIADAAGCPIALHGGSGVARLQLAEAIAAGVGKINVSSRVSRALAAGIRATWAADPDELDLRRYLGAGRQAVRELAAEYLALTGAAGRAAASTAPVGAGWRAPDDEPE